MSNNLPSQATLLVGPESEIPSTVPERTIYFCTDSNKYKRFENGLWIEIVVSNP